MRHVPYPQGMLPAGRMQQLLALQLPDAPSGTGPSTAKTEKPICGSAATPQKSHKAFSQVLQAQYATFTRHKPPSRQKEIQAFFLKW